MGAAVVHWEVRARDAARLQQFYASVFGWTVNADNPQQYGLVDTGIKMGINGGIAAGDEHVPPGPTFYIQVEDLDAHLAKVETLGGKTQMSPVTIPNMITMATFVDPEGNLIGLVQGPQTVPRKATSKKRKSVPKRRTPSKNKPKRKARRK